MSAAGWDHNGAVLIVNLERALKETSSTLEAFWIAVSTGWAGPFRALRQSRNSRDLRHHLVASSLVMPGRLAYCQDTLASAGQWRRRGGRVALVSDYPQDVTEAVARHLNLFDEVHGQIGGLDVRHDRLALLYGHGGYAELGSASGIEAPFDGLSGVVAVSQPADENASASRVPAHLRLMRPHQWLKNLLLFVPMIAAHELTMQAARQALLAFAAFCLIASSTYILNDLIDLSSDRVHPRKCNRPLASGAVSLLHGTLMMPALALGGVVLALLSGPKLLGMLALYFLCTTVYSFKLKRIVVIDICMLSVLYTLRILAGSIAVEVACSVWLLAFSIFFFFSLAAVKRQAELVDGIASGLISLHGRGYRASDLPVVGNIVTASGMVSVMVLAFYTNSEPVMQLYERPEMLWGICLVLLFWNSRVAILTQRGEMHDDPLVFAARDGVSQMCGLIILALALAATVL